MKAKMAFHPFKVEIMGSKPIRGTTALEYRRHSSRIADFTPDSDVQIIRGLNCSQALKGSTATLSSSWHQTIIPGARGISFRHLRAQSIRFREETMVAAVDAAPNLYKVLFENDRVRVSEARYRPGDKSVMHSHPAIVAYLLGDMKAIFSMPNGQTMDIEAKAGEALFMEAQDHGVENVGTTDVHAVLVELK